MSVTAIITCKGRLAHLKRTLPELLQHTSMRVVVVDWFCPDGTADWAMKSFPSDRVTAVSLFGGARETQEIFHKAAAINAGLRAARRRGCEFVALMDADTIVPDGRFEDWLLPRLRADRFLIVRACWETQDLTGVLVAHERALAEAGDMDERFMGWGSEDLDLRIRLYLGVGIGYEEIQPGMLRSIDHRDDLRTRFQPEKDKFASHRRNLGLLEGTLRRLAQEPLDELLRRPEVIRLLRAYGGDEAMEAAARGGSKEET